VSLAEGEGLSEEGRSAAFARSLAEATSWQRRKALVDTLRAWPRSCDRYARSPHETTSADSFALDPTL
jgi:hypothetical protein